ncbi:MAG: methionyl-tRNA formyltransferase [Dehalococcoidia bacterium]|nr:methionyl-tRNA formyltransferase [Dehalococcoidia bacterium]
MGSPSYVVGVLEAILTLGHNVVGVYTQPDKPSGRGRSALPTPVKSYALSRDLQVFQPPSLRAVEAQQDLALLEPDLVVVAAYGKLLPTSVLELPPHGCLNIHPSLLPKFRGPSPVASAILEEEEPTGATVMLLDEGMDTGPILAARELWGWTSSATAQQLTEKLFELGAEMMAAVLADWLDGAIAPQAQDNAGATSTRKLEKTDGAADWTLSARELEKRCRAFTPWPGLYTTWGGKTLKVLSAQVVDDIKGPEQSENRHGTVGSGPGFDIGVATGRGVLAISSLQMEGKRAVSPREFLQGYPEFVGSVLPS